MSSSVTITNDFTGRKGVVNTVDTAAVTGPFCAITILADATFSALAETDATGSLVGLSLPAGLTIHGNITGFTLSSGAVRAYKA